MKQEKLFQSLADIGDDLLMMAQNRTFLNPWKRWGKLAACIALVLCLGIVALPYFPMGCGSSMEMAPTEIPAQTPAETPAERPAEEAPAEEEAVEQESAAEAPKEETQQDQAPEEVVTVWFADVSYEVLYQAEVPEDLGELLGEVQASDGRDLSGHRVFAASDADHIYIEIGEDIYLYAEKALYQTELP